MSSDEEEAELRAMRRARAAREGGGGMSQLRASIQELRAKKARTQGTQHAPMSSGLQLQQEQQERRRQAAEEEDEDAPVVVGGDASAAGESEQLRKFFPDSFGKAEAPKRKVTQLKPADILADTETKKILEQTRLDQSRVEDVLGPGSKRGRQPDEGEGAEADDEDDDEDEEGGAAGSILDQHRVPISNEATLSGHTKAVSALSIDRPGTRLLTGSYDNTVRIYDFQGMNRHLQPFRTITPSDGHPVVSLSWSPNGEHFMCATGSAQLKVYDRDGKEMGETVRGDMYIRDMKHTKGHVSSVRGGVWHPQERHELLSCSDDGTLRIWDAYTLYQQKVVIKPQLRKPGRFSVTACAYAPDGKLMAGAITDGSLQLWSTTSGFSKPTLLVPHPKQQLHLETTSMYSSRPTRMVKDAWESDTEVTSLAFSPDSQLLFARADDSTLKVWDVRVLNEPVKVFDGLPLHYGQTDISFSPDGELAVTGTGRSEKGEETGQLAFIHKTRLEIVAKLGFHGGGSVVRTAWHRGINQLFVGLGSRTAGTTRVLYDPNVSQRGIMTCVGRAPRKRDPADVELKPVIHTPHALPMFKEGGSRKRQREKTLQDPVRTRQPEGAPIQGHGKGVGGRLGQTSKSLLSQYLLKEGGLLQKGMEADPRQSILRHAQAAAENPLYAGSAYAETQPETILQDVEAEEDEQQS